VIHQVKTIGWGFGLILVLGGVGHVSKTWAWRLTFACEIKNVSFARTFALRLVSEAIAILGLPGQVIGEAARVSLLGSDVPVANSIASVTPGSWALYRDLRDHNLHRNDCRVALSVILSNVAIVCAPVRIGSRGSARGERSGPTKALAGNLRGSAGDRANSMVQGLVGW